MYMLEFWPIKYKKCHKQTRKLPRYFHLSRSFHFPFLACLNSQMQCLVFIHSNLISCFLNFLTRWQIMLILKALSIWWGKMFILVKFLGINGNRRIYHNKRYVMLVLLQRYPNFTARNKGKQTSFQNIHYHRNRRKCYCTWR